MDAMRIAPTTAPDPTVFWSSRHSARSGGTTGLPDEADVVIVGAGLSGLSTARALQRAQPGAHVLVLDRAGVGAGASGRNAGMVVPLVGAPWLLPGALPDHEATWALDEVARRFDRLHRELSTLDAGIEPADFYVGSPHSALLPALRWLSAACRERGLDVDELDRIELAARTGEHGVGAIRLDAWRIDPLRLCRVLAAEAASLGVQIVEGANVTAVIDQGDRADVLVDGHTIKAQRAVVAAGAWGRSSRLAERTGKVYQTFMVASEPLSDETIARLGGERALVVGLRRGTPYRRVVDRRLLFGGLDRRVGNDRVVRPDVDRVDSDAIEALRCLARRSLPWLDPLPSLDVAWGGPIESRGPHELPLVDWRPGSRRVVEVTGMSGSGVFWALQMGDLVRSLLDGPSSDSTDTDRLRRCLAATRVPVGGVLRTGWAMLAHAAA